MRDFSIVETKTLEEFVRREGSRSQFCDDNAAGVIRNFCRFDWRSTGSYVWVDRYYFPGLPCPRNNMYFAGGQLAVFQGGPSRTGGKAPISESYGSSESGAAGRKNGQLAPARRVAMKMGRRLSRNCGIGHVSVQICSLLTPCRRPILIATKYLVFRGQDTSCLKL